MRDYLQLIGHALRAQCPPEAKTAMLYAEVETNVISASVFFTASPNRLNFRYASDELEDLVCELWEVGQEGVPAESWAAIEYMLDGNKLDVALTYSNQLSPDEGQHDRRPRVVARRFPGFEVDFSQPE